MAGCTDFDPIRTTNKLTVEQVDRDAGADLFLREQFTPLSAPHFRIAKDARAGKHDDWDCIQAFARHRQQAEARAEGLVAALEVLADSNLEHQGWPGMELHRRITIARDALTAYRSARP